MHRVFKGTLLAAMARRWPAWLAGLFVTALALAGMAAPASANAAGGHGNDSHRGTVSIPVQVPGDTTTYHIRGELGWRGDSPNRELPTQLLISGLSYDRWFWDSDYGDGSYSYVQQATRVSVTFNYDQLGTTEAADHPPMSELSLVNQAEVADQVLRALRTGVWVDDGHSHFYYRARMVIVTGHSLGAEEALVLAATHPNDPDGIIAADYMHVPNPAGAAAVQAARVPSQQTAKYASEAWTAGSVTTADGNRGVFYYQPGAAPGMIAADEARKAVAPTPTAIQAAYIRTNPGITASVTAPVLEASGEYDGLGCNAGPTEHDPTLKCGTGADLVARERPFFPNTACLKGYSEPDAGHDINLHYNRQQWFAAANRWVQWLATSLRVAHLTGHPVRC